MPIGPPAGQDGDELTGCSYISGGEEGVNLFGQLLHPAGSLAALGSEFLSLRLRLPESRL